MALAFLSGKLLAADHRLLNVFFVYRKHTSRVSRAFVAWATLVLIFWAEAVAAIYVNPYGVCEQQKSEHNCEELRATTGLFTNRRQCEWHAPRPRDAVAGKCVKFSSIAYHKNKQTLRSRHLLVIIVVGQPPPHVPVRRHALDGRTSPPPPLDARRAAAVVGVAREGARSAHVDVYGNALGRLPHARLIRPLGERAAIGARARFRMDAAAVRRAPY